jgi:hypothetical protein
VPASESLDIALGGARSILNPAFAVVEWAADGKKLRHLPHHDETGALDPAHLRAARQRLGQVKWLDPASADAAARHLAEHTRELGLR